MLWNFNNGRTKFAALLEINNQHNQIELLSFESTINKSSFKDTKIWLSWSTETKYIKLKGAQTKY